MEDQITIETDRFEHREVKPHFINPCCFGEDLAEWLRSELAPLRGQGIGIAESIQEDWGWGFWVTRGKDTIWIALSYCGEGPVEEPGQWVVTVAYEWGLNPLRRLFHKPDMSMFSFVRNRIWEILRSAEGIRIVEEKEH